MRKRLVYCTYDARQWATTIRLLYIIATLAGVLAAMALQRVVWR